MNNTSKKHINISKFINLTLSVFMLFTCITFTGVKANEDETGSEETTAPVVENEASQETEDTTEGDTSESINGESETQEESGELQSTEASQDDSNVTEPTSEQNDSEDAISLTSSEGEDTNGDDNSDPAPAQKVQILYQIIVDDAVVKENNVCDKTSFKIVEEFDPSTSTASGSEVTGVNSNYVFVGWYEKNAEGVETKKSSNTKFVPEAPTGTWTSGYTYVYYAKFVTKQEVTINYVVTGDVDGGSLDNREETFNVGEENKPAGTGVHVSSYYEFVGWYDNADCTGDPISTDATATFVPTTPEGGWTTGTYTYYAKFHYKDDYLRDVTINYYWIGDNSNTIAKSDVLVKGKKIGENVSIGDRDIDNISNYKAEPYTKTSKSITVREEASKNVINFYYYKRVKLVAKSAEFPFDFENHSVSGFDSYWTSDTQRENPLSITFAELSASATGKNIGSYTSSVTKTSGTVEGTVDDSGLYYVESTVDGTLSIKDVLAMKTYDWKGSYTGRTIKGTAPDINPVTDTTVEYSTDGKAVTDPTKVWTEDQPGFVNAGVYKVDAKATNANYNPSVVYGSYTVTITPKDISNTDGFIVKVGNIDDVNYYDGQEHKVKPTVKDAREDFIKINEGTDYDVSFSEDVVNAGTVTVTVTGKGNFTGSVTRTYKINPRPVTLTSADADKVYDGTPLTNSTVTVTEGSFLEGEEPEIQTTGTITNVYKKDGVVSSVPNTFEVKEKSGSKYKASNYDITKIEGGLTILPVRTEVTVTITGIDSVITYDGKYHAVNDSYTAVASNPLYKVEGEDKFYKKNDAAGESYKDVTPEGEKWTTGIKATDFVNVTDNFTDVKFVVEKGLEGSLTIIPRTYTVTTYSASRNYNGKALTASGKIENLAEGDTATFTITGSQTEIGSSKNTYKDFKFTGDTKASNYVHGEDSIGTLTVTSSGWDDGGPFTTDTCGNVFDRWGNKIYEAKGCNVGGYNLVSTSVTD